MRFVLGAD